MALINYLGFGFPFAVLKDNFGGSMANKKVITHNVVSVILVSGLFALTSCGNNKSSSVVNHAKAPEVRPVVEKEEFDPGEYEAQLLPVNPTLKDSVSGEVTLKIKEDDFVAIVEVNGADSGIKHYQEVLTGAECPDENADTNFDGVIDYAETQALSGKTLLPLDSKLQNQIEGIGYGPIANEEGYYLYRRSASYKSVLEDLLSFDDEPEDDLVKLQSSEKMRLVHKVVVVYGIATNVELPESVKVKSDRSLYESIPVLCGKLKRIGL